jgi:hypothetical protein
LIRSGNHPSHEQADVYLDKAVDLCRRAGFRKTLLRGDRCCCTKGVWRTVSFGILG